MCDFNNSDVKLEKDPDSREIESIVNSNLLDENDNHENPYIFDIQA